MKIIGTMERCLTCWIISGIVLIVLTTAALAQSGKFYYTDKLYDVQFSFAPKADELMIRFAPQPKGLLKKSSADMIAQLNLETIHEAVEKLQFGVYKLPANASMEATLQKFKADPSIQAVAQVVVDQDGNTRYFIPDEFTVRFNETVSENEMLQVIQSYGCKITKDHWTRGYYRLSLPAGRELFATIREFMALPQVKFSELCYVGFNDYAFEPNDTFFAQQWALQNDGTGGGTNDADIDAREAWDIERGDPNILVGIIDSGVDWDDHADLRPNIAQNLGEDFDGDGHTIELVAGDWTLDPGDLNGVDNDANGQTDDLIGWDFDDDDNNPHYGTESYYAHGTSCAGIVAAVTNNASGVSGIAHQCRIMPLRINLYAGMNDNRADAINYAASFMGTYDGVVLSCSWKASGDMTAIRDAIEDAKDDGVVLCFASGNEDDTPISYPAAYTGDAEPIAVGATSECDERKSPTSCDGENWWGSNYGDELDISAPGVHIYTTDCVGADGYDGGDYVSDFNGTSAATPHVSAAAALLLSYDNSLTPDEVKDILQVSADKVGGYDYNHDLTRPGHSVELGYGRLNVNRALQELIARSVIALQPTPVDISISIDRSGSMTTPKLNAVRNAASQVVRLMNTGDRIAVVSFSTTTTTEFPLTTITSDVVKTNAISAINAIDVHPYPDIFTSIGGGLWQAQGTLFTASPPYYPQAIILMSDGLSNRPPFITQIVPAFIPVATDAYTIGFATTATDIDEDSLQYIASQTGGVYFFAGAEELPTTTTSSANALAQSSGGFELIKSYQASLNLASFRDLLKMDTKYLYKGLFQDSILVDASIDEVRFSLLWEDTTKTVFTLVSPGGRVIDPAAANIDPLIDYLEDLTLASYSVRDPERGMWQLKGRSAGYGRYFLSASAYSQLKSFLSIKNPGTGLPMIVELKLLEKGLPVLNSTPSARIKLPNDEIITLPLFDDGKHQDGSYRDGLYANFISNTGQQGSYSVEAFITGVSEISGDTFNRYNIASTFIRIDKDSNAVRVALPDKIAPPSSQIKIPIFVHSDVFGRTINSYLAKFAFDPLILKPTGLFASDGTMSEYWSVDVNTARPGQIEVKGNGTMLRGDGILINLYFDVVGNRDDVSPLKFTRFEFNNGAVPVKLTNGSLKVGDTFINQTAYPFSLEIKKVFATPGQNRVRVPIFMNNQEEVGGWETLMRYDMSDAKVTGAELCDSIFISDPEQRGWYYAPWARNPKLRPEYFNCILKADGHPDWVRTVGIMNLNFPRKMVPDIPAGEQWLLYCLLVNVDSKWKDRAIKFNFHTTNCTDNTLASSDGYTLWGPDSASAAWKTCPERPASLRLIRLLDGVGIVLTKALIGDINLNNIPYEVGDAIVFINYLIYGPVVLIDEALQTAASDINGDGRTWTIADLVRLIRIINGQHKPFIIKTPETDIAAVDVNLLGQTDEGIPVAAELETAVGGAYFVFKVDESLNIRTPVLSVRAQNMTLAYHRENDELRVVLYSFEKKHIEAGGGILFTLPIEGDGAVSLYKTEFSDTSGNLLDVQTAYDEKPASLPTEFSLTQNYPNPFNPVTAISYQLPVFSEMELSVYNLLGQKVATLVSAKQPAGSYKVEWDATGFASGVYFYRLTTDQGFIETRKLVLLR